MQPWDRQNGEKDRDWAAFKFYLSCRNKAEVAREHKISKGRIYQRAKYWDWDKRAQAYDNWLQQAEDKVLYEGREQLAREHLEVIRRARTIADEALQALLAAIRSGEEGMTLSPKDALSYLEKAVTLERLVTGEATERTEETFDLSKISGAEAEELLATLEKMK